MTSTKPNPRTEALTAALGELQSHGQIIGFTTDTVANKRVWNITVPDDMAAVLGDFHATGLATPEVEAFVAGIKYGNKRKPIGRVTKDNPYRNAILDTGRVEVSIADVTPLEQKRLRTAIFNAAYSLGLKGKFKVRTDADAQTLVGEVTDRRSLRGKQAQAHHAAEAAAVKATA